MAKGRRGSSRDKKGRTKGNRKVRSPLPEEIVWEILVLLPVKSLLRFKTVCKAWEAIISDPAFIRAQLRWSVSRWEQDPTFLISPNILNTVDDYVWPPMGIDHLHFYQWKQGAPMAEYMHDKNSMAEYMHNKNLHRTFYRVREFAHCDGLVLAPTFTKLYLFNPATREVLTLPDSKRNDRLGFRICHCAGLGLDPSTGEYKVVQAFDRPLRDFQTSMDTPEMGMEAFTVGEGGGAWREISDKLPYPVKKHQIGLTVNGGFLFWRINKKRCPQGRGIICLDLKEEEFSVIGLPDPALDDAVFTLDVLHGRELCLAACTNNHPATMTMWTMSMDEGPQWERRYSIHVPGLFRPLAIAPGGSGIILWKASTIYRYELATSELTTLCQMDRMRYQGRSEPRGQNPLFFNVMPYTASLVPLTTTIETILPSRDSWLHILQSDLSN